ncbi:MAG: FIST N-terminal domain-containing protein, partial [Candidatus Omnitrophota bacterium]
MATRVGIGFSQNYNTRLAAQEAADQAKKYLQSDRVDLAIVFSTIHYAPPEVIPVVFEIMSRTRIIGASTPSIILPNQVANRGVAVMAIISDQIRFESGCVPYLKLQNKTEAGRNLVKSTLSEFGQKQRQLFLCIADGLLDGLSDLIDGIKQELLYNLPLILVGSSDDFRFKQTFQYYKDTAMSEGAASLVLGGRMQIGISIQHGFKPIGKPRTVDKVDGPLILSINGRKASALYEQYFGKEAETLKKGPSSPLSFRYPLGVRLPGSNQYILRNVLGVLDGGAIICQDKVPKGAEVNIMIGNQASYLHAAEEAARDVRAQLTLKKPSFVLVFESIARCKLLGRGAAEEISTIRDILGDGVPMLGMFCLNQFFRFSQDPSNDPWL